MKRIIELPDNVVKAIQNGEDYRYDIHTAIAQSTPYNPTGDAISREALKEAFEDCTGDCACCIHNTNDFKYCGLIDNAQAVEQNWRFYYDHGYKQAEKDLKRPQGEWINEHYDGGFWYHTCNKCKSELEITSTENFCRNCGADMRAKENKNV